jgi:hypothetical protein
MLIVGVDRDEHPANTPIAKMMASQDTLFIFRWPPSAPARRLP